MNSSVLKDEKASNSCSLVRWDCYQPTPLAKVSATRQHSTSSPFSMRESAFLFEASIANSRKRFRFRAFILRLHFRPLRPLQHHDPHPHLVLNHHICPLASSRKSHRAFLHLRSAFRFRKWKYHLHGSGLHWTVVQGRRVWTILWHELFCCCICVSLIICLPIHMKRLVRREKVLIMGI